MSGKNHLNSHQTPYLNSHQTHTTGGNKDLFTKVSYVFTGIVLLVMINISVRVMIKAQDFLWYYFLLVVVFVMIFWRMRRMLTQMRYTFTPQDITLHMPGNKNLTLSTNQIKRIETDCKVPWWYGRGIKIHWWSREIACTTASTGLMRIYMTDGKRILISPRILPPKQRYPQWK